VKSDGLDKSIMKRLTRSFLSPRMAARRGCCAQPQTGLAVGSRRSLRAFCVLATLLGLGVMGLGVAGCEKPVFTPDEPRSQYDRFDAIRDQRAPSYVFDEFGARRPNVRQRLLVAE
jgi:hypothetical protein